MFRRCLILGGKRGRRFESIHTRAASMAVHTTGDPEGVWRVWERVFIGKYPLPVFRYVGLESRPRVEWEECD